MVAGPAGGRPKMGEEKLIIRSAKVRFVDILSLLFLRRPLTSYPFVDAGDQTALDVGVTPSVVALSKIIQKALAAAYYPLKWTGAAVEFLLNFVALNGGLLGIVWNIFRCKLVIPLNREAPNFRTILGIIDGRTELKPPPTPSAADAGDVRQVQVVSGQAADLDCGAAAAPLVMQEHLLLEVTIMAAKIAYENAAYIENVVNNVWKFNFVGYYSCWNKFLRLDTTQAFVMTDRTEDANMVMLSFRGTNAFNTDDWSTDVNLSWLGMGAMGHVHVGFLKALGLQEEDGKDTKRAFPRDAPHGAAPAGKVVAYYELRKVLREQLKAHPRARVVVTGHSLGGALAALFPAVLALHGEQDVLDRIGAVHTYGQPRVGDATFVRFSRSGLPPAAAYLRVVYRYDVVPRVPFYAPPVAEFSHGGTCVYYAGWYDGKVLPGDEPNPNYFDPRYLFSMYGNAMGDLVKAMFLWAKAGRGYRESAVSLLFRATGLLIPGLSSHSTRDYVNAIRLGRIVPKPL